MNQSDNKNTCRLCGSKNSQPYIKELWQCQDCSFCFIPLNQEMEKEILKQYSENKVSSAEYYKKTIKLDQKNFYEKLRIIGRFSSPTTMIDVGGNVGTFSESAKAFDWQPIVFEPNPVAAEAAEQKGFKTIKDFFSFEACQKNLVDPVDCVVLNDVLEHVTDPVSMLKDVWKILNNNGVVAVTTPDIDNYFCQRYQIKPAEHLVYFSKKTLKEAFEKSGFEVLFCQSVSRFRNVTMAAENPTASMSRFDKLLGRIAKNNFVNLLLSYLLKLFVKDEILIIGQKNDSP